MGKEIEKEVRMIEVTTENICLQAEKIDNYFIREPAWDSDILVDVELEDIRVISLLLMEIYKEFKKQTTTKESEDNE